MHRGHPVNVLIRRTMHLSSVQMLLEKACLDTKIFLAANGDGTWRGKCPTTELPHFLRYPTPPLTITMGIITISCSPPLEHSAWVAILWHCWTTFNFKAENVGGEENFHIIIMPTTFSLLLGITDENIHVMRNSLLFDTFLKAEKIHLANVG